MSEYEQKQKLGEAAQSHFADLRRTQGSPVAFAMSYAGKHYAVVPEVINTIPAMAWFLRVYDRLAKLLASVYVREEYLQETGTGRARRTKKAST